MTAPPPPPPGFQLQAEEPTGTDLRNSTGADEGVVSRSTPLFQQARVLTKTDYTRNPNSSNSKDWPLPVITDASALPGAFFFLYMTFPDQAATKYQIVAYDPWVRSTDTIQSILNFYNQDGIRNLPYYEVFNPEAKDQWKREVNYYCGTYGTNKGKLSPSWYYSADTTKTSPAGTTPSPSLIASGVSITFWNQNVGHAGLFTSSPAKQNFDSKAVGNIMSIVPGQSKNFLEGNQTSPAIKSLQVDFYATFGGKLQS